MGSDRKRQKTIVIGAGPVGTLAAIYAAQRDHEVEIYELRSDLRDPSTTPLNFTKSINLALSERGVNAMRHSGLDDLTEEIMKETIPMRGRMIHGRDLTGELYEQSQQYDIENRGILAVDRGGLNKILLDKAEAMPNVKINFNYKLTGADFKKRKAWFEIQNDPKATGRNREIEIDFDFLIGADGAHSAARYHMMKFARLDYHQEYIDTLWCEFHIEAKDIPTSEDPSERFRISPNHLHIWPGKQFMFIAIPSFDGSFTCTLFLPSAHFAQLSTSPSTLLPQFFDTHFPGVTNLIPQSSLIDSFTSNPHLPLISIKCAPYHFSSSAVILGDAAHAMVPFYGQGMNAGLEDVRILFEHLDAHISTTTTTTSSPAETAKARATALQAYSSFRQQDAYAINDLALRNYEEMRNSVVSPVYKARKFLEEWLSISVPSLGWKTQYSRVSFGNERYSEVIRKSERQGRLLVAWSLGLGVPVLTGVVGVLGYGVANWWVRRNR